jgi:hypothetical protein
MLATFIFFPSQGESSIIISSARQPNATSSPFPFFPYLMPIFSLFPSYPFQPLAFIPLSSFPQPTSAPSIFFIVTSYPSHLTSSSPQLLFELSISFNSIF